MEKKVPVLKKGKFSINYSSAINEFERAMQKFPIKNILYKSVFRGRGLEFDTYRVFEPDDDSSMIDWKASLRSNELLAKKYIEERDINIYFLVDVSNSMLFGSGNKLKSEYAAELVAAMSHLIMNSGDRVGLIMFNDSIVKFLFPSRGQNQFLLLEKYLSDSELYGGDSDINKVTEYCLKHVKTSHNVFIIVSDFIRLKKSCERNLKILGTRFETVGILLRDPFDDEMPDVPFQFSVQDPYSMQQMILDPKIARKKYKEATERQKKLIKKVFSISRVDSLEILVNKPFIVPLVSFLKKRSIGRRRT